MNEVISMRLPANFYTTETQQMVHFSVLYGYKILLTAVQNTNVLMSC
jgi:hypothetical protein